MENTTLTNEEYAFIEKLISIGCGYLPRSIVESYIEKGLMVEYPLENPFYIIRPDGSLEYYHTNAEPYLLNRDPSIPHVITEADDAYRIFTAHGFSWGGNWSNPKDYQHFEKLT